MSSSILDQPYNCTLCGEFHKTHPTREGATGWLGHICLCWNYVSSRADAKHEALRKHKQNPKP